MRRVLGAGFPGASRGVGGSTVSQTGSSAISPSNPGAGAGMVLGDFAWGAVELSAAGPGMNSLSGSPPIISSAADALDVSVREGAVACGVERGGAAELVEVASGVRAGHLCFTPKARAPTASTPNTSRPANLPLLFAKEWPAASLDFLDAVVRRPERFGFPIKDRLYRMAVSCHEKCGERDCFGVEQHQSDEVFPCVTRL